MTSKQPTVFIADDVEIMRELLERYLEDLDCKIIGTADNGLETISKIQSLKPDIAFLDINMPDKNGFEVLDELKNANSDVFSVIVSAHGNFDNLKVSIEKGAKGFIVKPYNSDKVKDIIDKFKAGDANLTH